MVSLIYNYLTDSEKNEIIESRIKSHEYAMFNTQITKLEFLSVDPVDQIVINDLETQILDLQAKIDLLKSEQAKLTL